MQVDALLNGIIFKCEKLVKKFKVREKKKYMKKKYLKERATIIALSAEILQLL